MMIGPLVYLDVNFLLLEAEDAVDLIKHAGKLGRVRPPVIFRRNLTQVEQDLRAQIQVLLFSVRS